MTMRGPLKAVFTVERSELPFALLMFTYFFLVITSFWILKPLKKSLFIEHYDQSGFDLLGWQMLASQAELLAKVLNMGVAFAAVVVVIVCKSLFLHGLSRTLLSHGFLPCSCCYRCT